MARGTVLLVVVNAGVQSTAALHPSLPWVRPSHTSRRSLSLHATSAALGLEPEELARSLSEKRITLVDVRMPSEYRLDGCIQKSVNLPSHDWEHGHYLPRADFATECLEEFEVDASLCLCCRDGSISKALCPQLNSLGFTSVTFLQGGLIAWEADGFPIELDDDEGLVGAWV